MPETSSPKPEPADSVFDEIDVDHDGVITREELSRWERWHGTLHRNRAMSLTTKIVVTIVGVAVLIAGLIMMVAPGPGILGIVAGLAILSLEWEWADRWLVAARRKLKEAQEKAAAMDPAVRRRRVILTVTLTVLVVGGIALYVALQDWPNWSVDGWDKLQSFIGFVPDLPGM